MPKYKDILNCHKRSLDRRATQRETVYDNEPSSVDAGSVSFTIDNVEIEQSAAMSGASSAHEFLDNNHEEFLSDLSSSDDEDDCIDVRTFLRNWTQRHNIKQTAVSDLLKGSEGVV